MMKKWKEIKDKPITWGNYIMLCVVCAVISIPAYIYVWAESIYLDGLTGFIEDIKDKFKKEPSVKGEARMSFSFSRKIHTNL